VHVRQVPVAISTIIGDIVHNLRPALDSLAYEMAVRHVGRPLKDAELKASAFPMRATPGELGKFFTAEPYPRWLQYRIVGIFGSRRSALPADLGRCRPHARVFPRTPHVDFSCR
jgi:hypothetical protein